MKLMTCRSWMYCCLLVTSMLALPQAAHASLVRELPRAEQAVAKVLGATTKAVKQSNYNFNAGVCFGIAVVRKGDKIQTSYPLERGVRYLFIGGGDNNAQNIDIAVLDSKGTVMAQDNAPDAIPVVFFTPKYTGNYNLAMRLKSGKAASSFCSLVVMRNSGGYALPISSIREAIRPEQLPAETHEIANTLQFHRVRNQWAVFGAVLKQGDATVVPNLKYESGLHVFVAGSDGRSTDVDLYLLNSAGQKLTEATKGGAEPSMSYQTDGSQTYQLGVANVRSKGASLVFLTAFDIKAGGGGGGVARAPVRGNISVVLNGELVQFENADPIEVKGRVMVPLRELFETLGASVQHDARDNSFYVRQEGHEIKLTLNSPMIVVNNRSYRMDAAPLVHNGTAMVPLRVFIQAAGAQVDWNGQQRRVTITVPDSDDDD